MSDRSGVTHNVVQPGLIGLGPPPVLDGCAASLVPHCLPIACQADGQVARREARALAAALGFAPVDAERLVLAVSELATNLARYARRGMMTLSRVDGPSGPGIQVESRDEGPGIADVDLALCDGFSTGGGLGNGLPAVRRLMDEFELATGPEGTRIVARKWPTRRWR